MPTGPEIGIVWDLTGENRVSHSFSRNMESFEFRMNCLTHGVTGTQSTKAGQAIHFNATAAYNLGKHHWTGPNAYYLRQITDGRANDLPLRKLSGAIRGDWSGHRLELG